MDFPDITWFCYFHEIHAIVIWVDRNLAIGTGFYQVELQRVPCVNFRTPSIKNKNTNLYNDTDSSPCWALSPNTYTERSPHYSYEILELVPCLIPDPVQNSIPCWIFFKDIYRFPLAYCISQILSLFSFLFPLFIQYLPPSLFIHAERFFLDWKPSTFSSCDMEQSSYIILTLWLQFISYYS